MAQRMMESYKPLHKLEMCDVLERGNMLQALKRVKKNKGCAGVDGITIEMISGHLKQYWHCVREELMKGEYKPKPVKVIHIPKPSGGTRQLGIPTVLDRVIQQALLQKLSPEFDKGFSESSYGFRPGRSAHGVIKKAKNYLLEGHSYTVDIDLEKFFDYVNHDLLMHELSTRIKDKVILRLIGRYLRAGILEGGLCKQKAMGTPQGSPLSPLLSNFMLDILDKELEKRGHKFCRYADDLQIYVKTISSGKRVLKSITSYIETRLKLKVNKEKSTVDKSYKRDFLGYAFLGQGKRVRIRCSLPTIDRFKRRVREITRGHRSRKMSSRIYELNRYIRGWYGYFHLCETYRKFQDLDGWIRSRLRMCQFKTWKHWKACRRNMLRLGVPREDIGPFRCNGRHWHKAQHMYSRFCMNNLYWERQGFRGLKFNSKRFGNS